MAQRLDLTGHPDRERGGAEARRTSPYNRLEEEEEAQFVDILLLERGVLLGEGTSGCLLEAIKPATWKVSIYRRRRKMDKGGFLLLLIGVTCKQRKEKIKVKSAQTYFLYNLESE